MKTKMTSKEYQETQKKRKSTKHKPFSADASFVYTNGNLVGIMIKPLSVNLAWRGKLTKSYDYYNYELALKKMLPPIELPQPPYEIYYKFGYSSEASDFDNPIKPTTDVLSKHYGFNDKLIRRAVIETEIVPKGKEFFIFELKTLGT